MTRSAVAAWLAFVVGLLAGGGLADPASFAANAVLGFAASWLGFAAASRCRMVVPSTNSERAKRSLWALAAGIVFGLLNLAANWLIANHHPALRALLEQRFAGIGFVYAVIGAPLTEEVNVRLFLMSVLAWLVWQATRRRDAAFVIALVASSVLFASMHLARPFPGDSDLAAFYRSSLLVKYTLAGLPMGWLFWRWGLPYAMLCHAAVNATHIALERFVF